MSPVFNADEIFEIAEQIERNGAKFYRRAAKSVANANTRSLLDSLATMEERHEKVFMEMRADLTGKELSPTVFDPEGESALYLQAMAHGVVFDLDADPAEELTGSEDLECILRKAIQLEKDSIVFYVGIQDMVPAKRSKDSVGDIIKEEMSHIVTLSQELAEIQK